MSELYTNFQKLFEIVVADTPELLEHVYRIRYQVLCVEKRIPGFEPDQCPDQLEIDSYDSHSAHVLLRYRPTREFIGTVRLILPYASQPQKKFPVELYGQTDPTLCDIQSLSRSQTAEISRCVVLNQFDRRKQTAERNDTQRKFLDGRARDRRSALNIALVLMAGVMQMSVKHNIKNWLSFMDPALNRLLGFYGLDFNPIGPSVDHHGIRRPYYIKVDDAMARMYSKHRDAWEVVTECGTYSSSQIN